MKTIPIKAQSRARQSRLEEKVTNLFRFRLKSAPVDGKANQELIALVVGRFSCSKAAVSSQSGTSERIKWSIPST